jgi:DNA repair exonuclease SbcCD ATPase subunit
MFSTALAPNAMAQKGQMLSPVTGWAVTQVNGTTPADSYCALARKFEQNSILTIARNQRQEASLAFDFQANVFETGGGLLNVVLDPGAGQQRVFDVEAASAKAVVVRLGEDSRFFAALAKTGFLRAEINKQPYYFNLADIDVGQYQLESCIAAVTAPAAGDEDSGMAMDNVGASSYASEISALRRQIESLSAENQKLSGMLESGGAGLGAPLDLASSNTLQARIGELETQNANLKLLLANADGSTKPMVAIGEKELSMIEELKAENLALRTELEQSNLNHAEVLALRQEMEALKTDNAQLKDIASVAGSDPDRAQAALMERLQEENDRLKAQLGGNVRANAEQSTLETKLSGLQQENNRLKAALDEAKASPSARQSQEEVMALRKEKERLEKIIADGTGGEAIVADLETQIQTLKEQNTTLSAQVETLGAQAGADFESKMAALQKENADLKASLSGGSVDAKALEDLKGQVSSLQEENRTLQQSAAAQPAGADKDKDAKLIELSEQVAALEALRAKNSELETKLQTAQAGVSPDGAALQEKVNVLEAENKRLEAQLVMASAQTEDEVDSFIKSFEEENSKLRQQLTDNSEKLAAMDAMQQELEKLKTENETILAAQANAGGGAGETAKQLETALAENQKLKEELESKGADAAELAATKEKLAALQNENDSMKLALSSKDDTGAANADLENLRAENTRLAEQVRALETAAPADVQAQLASLREENEGLSQSLRSALEKAELYQKQIEEQDATLAQVIKEKEDLLAQLDGKGGDHRQLASVQGELEQLRSENIKIRSELEDARAQLETAAAGNGGGAEESARIAKLEKELARASEEKQTALQGLAREYMKLKERVGETPELPAIDAPAMAALPDANPQAASPRHAQSKRMSEDLLAADARDFAEENLPPPSRQSAAEPVPATHYQSPLQDQRPSQAAGSTPAGKAPPPPSAEISAVQDDAAIPPPVLETETGDEKIMRTLRQPATPVVYTDKSKTSAQMQESRLIDEIQQELDTMGGAVADLGNEPVVRDAEEQSFAARMQADVDAISGPIDEVAPAMPPQNVTAEPVAAPATEQVTAAVPVGKAPPPPIVSADPAPPPVPEAVLPPAKANPSIRAELAAMKRDLPTADELAVEAAKKSQQENLPPPVEQAAAPLAVPPGPDLPDAPEAEQQMAQVASARAVAPVPPAATPDKESYAYTRQMMEQDARAIKEIPPAPAGAPVPLAVQEMPPQAMEVAARNPEPLPPPRLPPVSAQSLPGTDEIIEDVRANAQNSLPPGALPEELRPRAPAIQATYRPGVPVESVLKKANIAPDGSIDMVERASGPDKVVYQWKDGAMFASAEQRPLASDAAFDDNVRVYLEETEKRCDGEYAIVPDNTMQRGDVRIDSYEIACVGPAVNSMASLVFFNQNGTFTAVAHEVAADRMSDAMDARDKLLNSISGS